MLWCALGSVGQPVFCLNKKCLWGPEEAGGPEYLRLGPLKAQEGEAGRANAAQGRPHRRCGVFLRAREVAKIARRSLKNLGLEAKDADTHTQSGDEGHGTQGVRPRGRAAMDSRRPRTSARNRHRLLRPPLSVARGAGPAEARRVPRPSLIMQTQRPAADQITQRTLREWAERLVAKKSRIDRATVGDAPLGIEVERHLGAPTSHSYAAFRGLATVRPYSSPSARTLGRPKGYSPRASPPPTIGLLRLRPNEVDCGSRAD